MRLHELKRPAGSRKKPKRKGRGIGSGLGKTAGRGQGGQRSRSGGRVRPGFEGGQMPLQQRLPKKGFNNPLKKERAEVNIRALNRFDEGTEVTPQLLLQEGIVKSIKNGVKVLGQGELDKKLTVKAHSFSKNAVEKIEASGGKAEVI